MEAQYPLQKFVYKIHTTRLKKARWSLSLSMEEAMKNSEIIALADSTLLRFIDELNDVADMRDKVMAIREKIVCLRKNPQANRRKKELHKLYEQLNTLQFKPDYLCLVIDKDADYRYAYQKGFQVNGIRYRRLLATTGGVKGSTIIFTSERLYPALRERLDNGRNLTMPMVPAKFGAYEALTCSSSITVSHPNRILVVKDCETEFFEDVIRLHDSDLEEPEMTFCKKELIHKIVSDGFGLMLPQRAQLWAGELGLDYIPSGICSRPYAFCKGMLVTFDFHEFADTIAHKSMVCDAWGQEVDIHSVDVILTTSMLKLWDSYTSFDDYMNHCHKNHYQFCITKVCPGELEQERNLNYQFLQSYRLTPAQLDELIKPTIDEIKDILGADYRKSMTYLCGIHKNDENANRQEADYIKALMIDRRMSQDPYVQNCIKRMITKRITDAKIGVIKIHGNFQIACGDPFALCESLFGKKVTGLLGKGEYYSKYWSSRGVKETACFRAPMTCHNNIRKLYYPNTHLQQYWFRYIKTMLIFNSWDTASDALNGEDWDGDQNLTTDNPILLNGLRELPAILCIQKRADKKVITQDDLVQANMDSFGDDIGKYTNGITSQFDVQAQFPYDSKEYGELEYRIMCGQLFQQNAIDKTKGILSKPRPVSWFRYTPLETEAKTDFYKGILADKKPYFMKYIYPGTMKEYKKYTTNSNLKCQTRFGISLDELEDKLHPSEEEEAFLYYYHKWMPVGDHDCIANQICRRFEQEFDHGGHNSRSKPTRDNRGNENHKTSQTPGDMDDMKTEFDYQILKSEISYSQTTFRAIQALYKDYTALVTRYNQRVQRERIDTEAALDEKASMLYSFRQECALCCPDSRQLANIVLDLCYTTNHSKQFAWDMCRDTFIQNLLANNNYIISYPTQSPHGDFTFKGITFQMVQKRLCP